MILFEADWKYYPNAIVDTKTSNKTFLALADKYRQMGIKNYYFMLALHNPKLQGVNPFDPNLTQEQKIDIFYECKTNPWYYFREVARVPAMAGSIEPVQFRANRGNIGFYWCFFNHITVILIQPRQTGKTIAGDMLSTYIIDIGGNNTKMFLLTKGTDLQTEAIARIKEMRELLPKYIYTKDKKDSDNKTGLDNVQLNNFYLTGVARANQQAANNLGRGLTVPIVHVDEGPFITWIGTTLPALRAAGTEARAIAERNGAYWGTFFTTTAGRRDDRDGAYMYDFVHKAWMWSEVIFDCRDRADAWKMVDAGSRGRDGGASVNAVNMTMSHRQLGKTDQWLYNAIREAGGTREESERDFLNIWNSGSQRSPLTVELNQKIHQSKRDPEMVDVSPQNYLVRWYVSAEQLKFLKKNSRLVMGLDSSEAVGKDAIAMVVIDVATLAVVATSTVKFASLFEYTKWLASFLIEHPEIVLIPERKSSGPMIIDMLLTLLPAANVDPFRRIFNTIVDNARSSRKGEEEYMELTSTSMSQRDEVFYTERKKAFGFNTDKAKRDLLYGSILQNAARESHKVIHDQVLVQEILSLTEKNGRIDHSELGHDDHVIAWLMAHWLINAGTNLIHYGIQPTMVKSALTCGSDEELTPLQRYKEELQKTYLMEVEELINKLGESDNEAINQLYENRLRFLSKKIEASGTVKDFSFDNIIDRVRKEREKKQRLNSNAGFQDEDQIVHSNIMDMIHASRASNYRHTAQQPFYNMHGYYL
jgi:hypothetical protein